MKGLDNAEDVAIARVIAAGIAMHALVMKYGIDESPDKLVDHAFDLGTRFIQRAEKETP